MSEKLEALLQAVIDAETDTSYHYASESLTEAAPEILAMIKARTPAPEAVAWRVKDYADGWYLFYSEAAAQSSSRARNGALVQPLYASPVVPVGVSEESGRKLVGQDYINAIKAHRVEHGSSLAVARNAVDCGWRPPAPVVPVGVSDQQRAKIELVLVGYRNRITTLDAATDAIIAALRPTETGRE